MKKSLFAICVFAASFCALSDTETVDGITWNFIIEDEGAVIEKFGEYGWMEPAIPTSTSGAITIPSALGGHPVMCIDNYAFAGCSNLTSVIIPDSVTNIGDGAFHGCTSLSSVTIPESVQTLETSAFDGCDRLWTSWYRSLANLTASSGDSAGAPRYALASSPADRSIATLTVDGDCSIGEFALLDGKVFDMALRVVNVSGADVTLSLPPGHAYEKFKGTSPLTIPASSTNLLTLTRIAENVFFVAREQLEAAQ